MESKRIEDFIKVKNLNSIKKFSDALNGDNYDKAVGLVEQIVTEKVREDRRAKNDIQALSGVGESTADKIKEYGYDSIEKIAKASLEELVEIPGLGSKGAEKIKQSALGLIEPSKWISGYRHALEGIITSLKSDDNLALTKKIAAGNTDKSRLEEIKGEMRSRARQDFRSPYEMGFNEAWADVLNSLTE